MSQKQRLKTRDLHILKTYFELLRDLGKDACTMRKCDLYSMVSEKVFLSEKYVAKIIFRLMGDREAVATAKALMTT